VSCHDDKMEAYCNAVRALDDKFYGIELNHITRRYNEEENELAKIASGRITIPPNVFAQDVTKPSVNLEASPSNPEEPSGAPSSPAGAEPMDEDPSNEAFMLSLLEGYGVDKAKAMETEPPPPPRGGLAGEIPRLVRSRGASPGSVRSQPHHQDGLIVHPHRRRVVQARRVRHPTTLHPHPPRP
jgi:hypothetical protein